MQFEGMKETWLLEFYDSPSVCTNYVCLFVCLAAFSVGLSVRASRQARRQQICRQTDRQCIHFNIVFPAGPRPSDLRIYLFITEGRLFSFVSVTD